MFKLFDGVYDNLELFLIILLLTSLFTLIIYILISNRNNKRILIDKKNSLRKNKNTIRINYDKETIKIYDNNLRTLISTYSFSEFKSLIDYKSIDSFEKWIMNLKDKKEDVKDTLGVYLINTEDSLKHYVKLTFLNYYKKSKEAFIYIEEFPKNVQFSMKLLNNNDFYNKINSLAGYHKKSISGEIITLKITNMNFLRKRYGNDNANILLGEMFNRIGEINNGEDTFATYLQNNIFCIFKKDIKDRRQAKSYIADLISNLVDEPIEILNNQVAPTIYASYTLYGYKTYDIKLAVSQTMRALERSPFKFGKNRYSYYDSSLDSDLLAQNKDVTKIRDIIDNSDFKVLFEPILSLEQMNILGYVIHSRFNFYNEDDKFLTIYNLCDKYGLKYEFLMMYYRKVFEQCLKSNTKNYRILLKVDINHIEIIKRIWLENTMYSKIHLNLVVNYEDVIHPKKQLNFASIINDLSELRIKYSLIADENMLTIVSKFVYSAEMIIFDEFMVSNIEANDLKQISIDNIIDNTQTNKIKYVAYGISKYEQAEVLSKLGVDNLAGPYISPSLLEINNHEFLKNRSIQALNNIVEM